MNQNVLHTDNEEYIIQRLINHTCTYYAKKEMKNNKVKSRLLLQVLNLLSIANFQRGSVKPNNIMKIKNKGSE